MLDGESKKTTARVVLSNVPEDEKLLYANVIHINHTPWDFALHFHKMVVPVQAPGSSDSVVDVQAGKVATIVIPVTLVRGLISALQSQLDAYENSYGKIEIPK